MVSFEICPGYQWHVDLLRLCLCSPLGFPKAYPQPAAPQGPAKAVVLSLWASLLGSLASPWVTHHGRPRPRGRGRSLLLGMTCPSQVKQVERKGVQKAASGPFASPQNISMTPAAAMLQVHKGNMSWSWLSLFYRQDLSLFPPAAEAEQCSSSPPWSWALFHSQKRDLSMSWAIQASSVWDGDQRARNGNKNCRLPHESRVTPSDQSLPRNVTVPPWDTFHPELPPPRGTSSPKCHSNITTTPKLYGVQRVAKWANTPI